METTQRPVTIHYVSDTMCGWCHGFSPVVLRLAQETISHLNWTVTSGGLAIGPGAMPVRERAHYILPSLSTVTEHTGVPFGNAFADLVREGSYHYDSLPPARALAVYMQLFPGEPLRHLAALDALHHAIFVDGRNINNPDVLTDVMTTAGADPAQFRALLDSPQSTQRAEQGFAYAQSLGATGFPTLLAEAQGKWYLLARGYMPYERLKPAFEQLMQL